jgi:hypothetical protein
MLEGVVSSHTDTRTMSNHNSIEESKNGGERSLVFSIPMAKQTSLTSIGSTTSGEGKGH